MRVDGRFACLVALASLLAAGDAHGQGRAGNDETRMLREAAERESRGDLGGAERVLRELLGAQPASSGGLFALERVLRLRGRPEAILPLADAFLERDPSSSGVRYLKLRTLADLDSLDALRDGAEEWIELQPTSEVAYRDVARAFEKSLGGAEALAVLRRGRGALGRDDALALEIGDLLAVGGDPDGAVTEWAKAVGDDGGQAATVARRVEALGAGRDAAGRALVRALVSSDVLARRRAAVRIALDLGLGEEALSGARSVARELDERARASFLSEVARRAQEVSLVQVAAWAYEQLGRVAASPAERRQFDQRMVDVALAAGDTATALESLGRVIESFTPGSVDRRRAAAQAIRLEGTRAGPGRLAELLGDFRREFPSAPELDELAANVAAGLHARGNTAGADAVLVGIEGPRSRLERAYLLLDERRIDEGRASLLLAVSGLEPSEATEVIQFAGLLGRVSEAGAALLSRAGVAAHRGRLAEAAELVANGLSGVPASEAAPLLAQAARWADRGGARGTAATLRTRLLTEHPGAAEVEEASLALARHHARSRDGVAEAIRILEELIVARPNAAVVPDARLELERLRRRQG